MLAEAKCQPAQTDGVKSRAVGLTLVGSDEGWEGSARRCRVFVFCVSVDVVNIKRDRCCCQDRKVKSLRPACFAGAFCLCGMLSICHRDKKMSGMDKRYRGRFVLLITVIML